MDMSKLSQELGLSVEEIEKAAKRLVKQREYRKNHPSKSAGTKWADLSDEDKAKRLAYTKEYNAKKQAILSRVRDMAEELGLKVDEFLDQVEDTFLGETPATENE